MRVSLEFSCSVIISYVSLSNYQVGTWDYGKPPVVVYMGTCSHVMTCSAAVKEPRLFAVSSTVAKQFVLEGSGSLTSRFEVHYGGG